MAGASPALRPRGAGADPAGMSAFVGWGGQGIVNVEAGSSLMISDTHDYIDADTEGLLLSIGSPRNGAAGFGSLTARGIGAEILLDGNNASIGVGVTNNAITGPGDAYGELRVLDRAHLGLDARD